MGKEKNRQEGDDDNSTNDVVYQKTNRARAQGVFEEGEIQRKVRENLPSDLGRKRTRGKRDGGRKDDLELIRVKLQPVGSLEER